MTITIATTALVEILTDALQTAEADPDLIPGIHLATHRADYGDEPGVVDLLAATSTDRFVVGHCWTPVTGQTTPCVWPVDATKTALALCKQLIAARGKEHTVDVEVVEVVPVGEPSGDEKPDHPGYVATLSETPALFKSDTEFQFHAAHESKFPLNMAHRVLSGTPTEGYKDTDGCQTSWNARVLAPIAAVSKRRKAAMQFWRSPDHQAHLVQIGPYWLGAAMPVNIPAGEAAKEPSIEPLLHTPGDEPAMPDTEGPPPALFDHGDTEEAGDIINGQDPSGLDEFRPQFSDKTK